MLFTNLLGFFRNPTRATTNLLAREISHTRIPSGVTNRLSISPPPSYGNLTVRSQLSADAVTLRRPSSSSLTVRSHQSVDTVRPHSAPSTAPPTYRSLPGYSSQILPENGHRVLQVGQDGLSVESARRRYAAEAEQLLHGAEREDNRDDFHIPAYVLQDIRDRTRQLQQPRATGHRRLRDINFNPPTPTEQATTATVAEQSLAPAPTRQLRRRNNFNVSPRNQVVHLPNPSRGGQSMPGLSQDLFRRPEGN